ncbi:MAG: hypothetical protein EOM91_13285 [Sphingobacteriia bacterium]|nr:hypothetical protein [Sphingobacteriia bacterium]NCC40886.1 hypothetical protein [Gammaproteobacteria bacterium]
MHAGRILASDAPAALMAQRGADSLEEAFIGYLAEASGMRLLPPEALATVSDGTAAAPAPSPTAPAPAARFSLVRLFRSQDCRLAGEIAHRRRRACHPTSTADPQGRTHCPLAASQR